jgi:hypothetical protein
MSDGREERLEREKRLEQEQRDRLRGHDFDRSADRVDRDTKESWNDLWEPERNDS